MRRRVTGWGQVRGEKQAVEGTTHIEATGAYVEEIRYVSGLGGEPWDGRDQTVVLQVAVSFP
jgi:hypothetical protein